MGSPALRQDCTEPSELFQCDRFLNRSFSSQWLRTFVQMFEEVLRRATGVEGVFRFQVSLGSFASLEGFECTFRKFCTCLRNICRPGLGLP